MASSPAPAVGQTDAAGRGGRGGGNRGQGRGGRGRSNGKIIPNAHVGRRNNNGAKASNSLDIVSGGRNNGAGLRHFSARGAGAVARKKGGGEESISITQSQGDLAVTKPSVEKVVKAMTDQDVLIEFGPHVRNGNAEATSIHKQYLTSSNEKKFIDDARLFLVRHKDDANADQLPTPNSVPCTDQHGTSQHVCPLATQSISHNSTDATVAGVGLVDNGGSQNNHCNDDNIPPPPGIGSIQIRPQQPVVSMPPMNRPYLPMPPQVQPVVTVESTPPPKKPMSSILPARTPQVAPETTPGKPTKARRTLTRCDEQPGRLLANQTPAAAFSHNQDASLTARPRSQLVARWILPLSYLRNRALRRYEEQKVMNDSSPENLTIRDALENLSVGLFRRGVADNGSQSSIITKEILAPKDGAGQKQQGARPPEDYFFNVDQKADSVFGEVPFYAPRTPGNVVFRLYFEDEPQVTLATGPCIRVIPSDGDIDSVLRFILSNFKSRTTNGISSMNSLASTFDLFSAHQNERYFDAAGRVAWGCICESRKLVEQAGVAYMKKKEELEEQQEADRIKAELPDLSSLGFDDTEEPNIVSDDQHKRLAHENDKNETADVNSKWSLEKYNNERKWREMQLAYASILKAALSNSSIHALLKDELLSNMKLQYELWCPFTESFAPNPFAEKNENMGTLSTGLFSFIGSGENTLVKCRESRHNWQKEVLGFIPQSRPILASAKEYRWKKNNRNLFKELSSAMKEIYHNEYEVSEEVIKRRENVRASIELIVSNSGEFPSGTKVVIFGSSANGFGSPNSDLDLCLRIPSSATTFTKEFNGVEAMSNLAAKLVEAGLLDVDTCRLTARIPIVKFNFPYTENGRNTIVECDLSLQNPLACLNTSLLATYSSISMTTCVLASIIKRWAKNRGINNPSQHTLSSYGYIIMLLHFLTSCNFDRNGFIRENASEPSPILPNIQLVDPTWAENPTSKPYCEISSKPKTVDTMICHPTEANYYVNSYFYRSGLEGLQKFSRESHFPETATGGLLASFFHYFAYDFDYNKKVVSLNVKNSLSPMDKEIKAEEDGWSLFRRGLAIEDPFELFYDIAHVLKASNFQHIRREFSLAYTKVVNAAYTDGGLPSGREIIDSICEPVDHE